MSEGLRRKDEVRGWVAQVMGSVWKPRPKEPIYKWAERRLRIPSTENEELAGQLWSSAMTPHVRIIMDWVRLPGKHELFIRKSSQTGITMAVLIIICWMMVHDPRNVLYCIDSAEEARRISKSRLKRWIEDNKLLEGTGVSDEDLNNLTYFLRSMTVYLAGSFAKGVFRNKSIAFGVLDEQDAHDEWEEGKTTVAGMRSRLKRPRNSKLLGFSSPRGERDSINMEYEAGTMERLQVRCPHCDFPQFLDWKSVIYSDPEFLADLEGLTPEEVPDREKFDLEYVRANAYYRCAGMKACKIKEVERAGMLQTCVPVSTAPPGRNARRRSLWISDLYSLIGTTMGDLAVQWIEAQGNKARMVEFLTERMGEPNRELVGTVREDDVRKLRMNYARGTLPVIPLCVNEAYFTLMVVDVQLNTYKWGKIAFSRCGGMYLSDWGEVATLDEIQDIADTPIPLPGGGEAPIYYGLMDGSDGKRQDDVLEFCHGREHAQHWAAIKGFAETQMVGAFRLGSAIWGGMKWTVYHVNDGTWKRKLLFGLIAKGRELIRKGGEPFLVLPRNIDQVLVNEVLAEELVPVPDKYNPNKKEFRKKSGQENDFLDILKYGTAFWAIVGAAWVEAIEVETEVISEDFVDEAD